MIYCHSHTLLGVVFIAAFIAILTPWIILYMEGSDTPPVKTRHNKNSETGESTNSALTFGPGCGHCLGIRSTVDLCRFCVLSLHREVVGVQQYTQWNKRCNPLRAVCTANTMALYSIKQKLHQVLFHLLFNISTIILEVGRSNFICDNPSTPCPQ